MRISEWSSDVCSSDLIDDVVGSDRPRRIRRRHGDLEKGIERDDEHPARHGNAEQIEHHPDRLWMADELAQVERAVAAMRPVRRRPKQIDDESAQDRKSTRLNSSH